MPRLAQHWCKMIRNARCTFQSVLAAQNKESNQDQDDSQYVRDVGGEQQGICQDVLMVQSLEHRRTEIRNSVESALQINCAHLNRKDTPNPVCTVQTRVLVSLDRQSTLIWVRRAYLQAGNWQERKDVSSNAQNPETCHKGGDASSGRLQSWPAVDNEYHAIPHLEIVWSRKHWS